MFASRLLLYVSPCNLVKVLASFSVGNKRENIEVFLGLAEGVEADVYLPRSRSVSTAVPRLG
jgi:hypothetical protein